MHVPTVSDVGGDVAYLERLSCRRQIRNKRAKACDP